MVYALAGIGTLILVVSIFLDLFRGKSVIEIGTVQILGVAAGVALILVSILIKWPKGMRFVRVISKGAVLTLFVVGVVLLAINMIGVFQSLRNPLVYDGIDYVGVNRVAKYTPGEVFEQMDRKTGESRGEYAKRLTQLIYDGVVHYWSYEGVEEFNLRVPITENYLLWLKRYETPLLSGKYEFCDARRAIERGVSICSQYTKILIDILNANGIKAKSMGLEGHVVALVQVDEENNTWWILDADFGVVIESNLLEIEENRDIAREKYQETEYDTDVIESILGFYGAEGNGEVPISGQCETEERLYQLKWIIPLASILPFSLSFSYSAVRKKLEEDVAEGE